MGVMCSLLGHDYGDADVERERVEQGNEVVRTAKRVKRCRNCGHERTVSENKEVTALEAAAGVVREPDGTVVAATDGMGESNDENGGIVIESESIAKTPEAPDTDTDTERAGRNESEESGNSGDIDEIRHIEPERLDTNPSRAPGEWPEEPETERVPDSEARESTGLDSSGSLTAKPQVGRWPNETDESPGLLQSIESVGNESESEPVASARITDRRPGTTFACASCGYTSGVSDSPLRAGDICPGCQHGYLAWETRKG